MKLTADRSYAYPALKILEIAKAIERGTPTEYRAGIKLTIERGWLWMHENGTYVEVTQTGAELLAS